MNSLTRSLTHSHHQGLILSADVTDVLQCVVHEGWRGIGRTYQQPHSHAHSHVCPHGQGCPYLRSLMHLHSHSRSRSRSLIPILVGTVTGHLTTDLISNAFETSLGTQTRSEDGCVVSYLITTKSAVGATIWRVLLV